MRHAGGAKASDHDGMRGAEFAVRMWRREGLLIERMDEIHGIPIAAIEDEDESDIENGDDEDGDDGDFCAIGATLFGDGDVLFCFGSRATTRNGSRFGGIEGSGTVVDFFGGGLFGSGGLGLLRGFWFCVDGGSGRFGLVFHVGALDFDLELDGPILVLSECECFDAHRIGFVEPESQRHVVVDIFDSRRFELLAQLWHTTVADDVAGQVVEGVEHRVFGVIVGFDEFSNASEFGVVEGTIVDGDETRQIFYGIEDEDFFIEVLIGCEEGGFFVGDSFEDGADAFFSDFEDVVFFDGVFGFESGEDDGTFSGVFGIETSV